MNGTRMKGAVAIVAFAGMAFGTSALRAQSGSSQEVDVAKAQRYEAAAERVGKTMEFFNEAAKYWEEAASLRPEGDCQAVQDMVNASRLKFYLGDKGKAQSLLQDAGEIAMAYGDVGTAARVFLDAAWIARARGQATVVQNLLTKAQKLAQSPLLEESQRDALLARIAADAD
jgi:ATP/maltotriose-dependent transcriptional regulator MalT